MKKTAFAIFMALILLSGLAACDRVKIEIKEPEEESIADGILYYPENVYEMDIEHFVNRENDVYISYLFRLVSSTGIQSVSNVPWHEYKGFSSGKELSSKQLLNFFFLADDYSDYYLDEENKDYLIPVSDIHTVLSKYFSEYDLDIHDHSYNFEYLEDDTVIRSLGFVGIDFIYHAGYSIDSVVDNGDGTVKITVFINGTEMTENDEIIPTGEISEVHTMVIEPDKKSCKICSYEVEYSEEKR